ncbi:MAG TPA: MarR family transcriptional regulator [Clostridiales bacterium]|nr:MarR family transcriptional regulator [Clostridiales bacterium]
MDKQSSSLIGSVADKPEEAETTAEKTGEAEALQSFPAPPVPEAGTTGTGEGSAREAEESKPSYMGYQQIQPTPLMLITEISKLFRDRIRDENMQNSYRMILFHLSMRGGRTQLELANITHLKPPTISVTLQKMEADGYVRRVPNERDMRQTLVYLTEKGEEYNKNIRMKIEKIDKEVASGFTDEELKALVSMLTRIRDNIRQSDDRPNNNKE